MSKMSNYLENAMLDHTLGVDTLARPSTVYLALFTSDPTDAGTGNEVSGSGYSRQSVSFGSASGGSASNSTETTFTASGGNFGTITHVGIYDSQSNGNLLYHGSLNTSRVANDGDTLSFAIGSITVSLD